jgi:hypothetical protein
MTKPTKHIFTAGQVVTNKQRQQAVVKQKEARGYSFTALGGVYEYDFHCTNARDISEGRWKHKTIPTVHSRGYIGFGKYTLSHQNHLAVVWRGMMNRCYDKSYHEATPTYIDCYVTNEWFDFQVFCRDVTNMIGYCSKDYNGKCFYFDKDILSDSKVYSEATCCFVPQSINILFRDKDVIPLGEKRGNSYRTESVGSFKTQIEMQEAYAQHRRDKALDLIKIYTGCIDPRVIEKLQEISTK